MPPGWTPLFALLLAFLSVQRLCEVAWSRRNLRRLGAEAVSREHPANFRLMVLLHAALVVLPGLEVGVRGTMAPAWLEGLALTLFVLAQLIRYWSISSLGRSWNQEAVVDPAQTVVAHGPYRFIRHPNYVAVFLEFVAVPLAGAAWLSLAALNLAHLPVILRRLRAEEASLDALPGYRETMGGKPRFLPRWRG